MFRSCEKNIRKPILRMCAGAQVVAQTQAVTQVVRRHLDGRLADRVGDLGHRVDVRLDDQNPRGRTRSAKLQRQRESRHTPADDAHVVIRSGVIGVARDET